MERMGPGGHEETSVSVTPFAGSRQPAPTYPNIPEPSYDSPYNDPREMDRRANLLRYLGIVRKHRWLVFGVAAVVFVVGTFVTFLATPMYRSTATVQIDREAAKVVQVEGVQSVETNDPGFYPTQYELLKSRSLATRIVADLNLTEDARFIGAGVPSAWAKLRRTVLTLVARGTDTSEGGQAETQAIADPVEQLAESGDPTSKGRGVVDGLANAGKRVLGFLQTSWNGIRERAATELAAEKPRDALVPGNFNARQEAATSRVMAGLTVQPVGTSRLVRVSFESPDPQVCAQIANAISEAFIRTTLDRRYGASSYARDFLQERLQELKLKLEDSEKQLVQYAQDQQIVGLVSQGKEGGSSSLAQARLAQTTAALAEATNERIRAEQLWNQAKTTNGLLLPQVVEDKTIDSIRQKRAQVAAEYEDGLKEYKPAYPAMLKLKSQIDEMDRQIQGAIGVVKGNIESKFNIALKQEDALRKYLEVLKKDVLEFERRNIQYKILHREVDTNNSLYEGLLQRYKEIGVAGGVGTNNVSIIDRAQIPGSPFKPNILWNQGIALAVGIFLGIAAAFAVEFFDDALKLVEDVESALGLPVLGVTPFDTSPEGVWKALDSPRSSLAEAVRSLRTALQFSTDVGAPRSLLVTSPRPSEGKTTLSLALAKSFAQLGLKVLLIDGDLRDPSLHREISSGSSGIATTVGLSNYLAGSASPPEVFQPTEIKTLTFLPAGPLPPNPAELLAGPKMPSLLRIAEEQFDLVIIDGPPVMGLADAPLLASVAAGTLLVVAANQSRRSISQTAFKRLQFARAHVLGAVFNKFDYRKAGVSYGYGYGDRYYYGYGRESAPKLTGDKAA